MPADHPSLKNGTKKLASGMYWLDTTILTLLVLAAVLGFWSGFLWQIARIAGLGISLVATLLFNDAASQFLRDYLLREGDPRLVQALAYAVVFFAVYLVLFFTSRLLYEGIRAADLVMVDRVLGCAFGAAKMALALGAICLAAANYPHDVTRTWMAKSTFAPTFAEAMERVLIVIPEAYSENLHATFIGLRDLVSRQVQQPGAAETQQPKDNRSPW